MAELTTDAQALSSEHWFIADSFGFGVEREMKESGEKGGTEAANAGTSGPQASFVIQFDRPVDPSPQQAADDAASSLGMSMGFAPDPFDFKATEADAAVHIGVASAQLTISGTISDLSVVDGRYSFVFDGNADTAGGQPYGDFLGGVFVGQDSDAMTSVEPTAPYFDGRFLTAHDLMREQGCLSETGFDLV